MSAVWHCHALWHSPDLEPLTLLKASFDNETSVVKSLRPPHSCLANILPSCIKIREPCRGRKFRGTEKWSFGTKVKWCLSFAPISLQTCPFYDQSTDKMAIRSHSFLSQCSLVTLDSSRTPCPWSMNIWREAVRGWVSGRHSRLCYPVYSRL